jgi:hypothetical protein
MYLYSNDPTLKHNNGSRLKFQFQNNSFQRVHNAFHNNQENEIILHQTETYFLFNVKNPLSDNNRNFQTTVFRNIVHYQICCSLVVIEYFKF